MDNSVDERSIAYETAVVFY